MSFLNVVIKIVEFDNNWVEQDSKILPLPISYQQDQRAHYIPENKNRSYIIYNRENKNKIICTIIQGQLASESEDHLPYASRAETSQ